MLQRLRQSPLGVMLFPALLLVLHAVLVTPNRLFDLHWGIYLMLFAYCLMLGEVQSLVHELRREVHKRSFLLLVLAVFFGSLLFTVGVYHRGDDLFYEVWFVPYEVLPLFWVFFYVLLQPVVDTVIFEKLLIGEDGVLAKVCVLLSIVVRTYLETGGLWLNQAADSADMLALAYFVSVAFPTVSYLITRKASVSFMGKVLYRASVAIMILLFVW